MLPRNEIPALDGTFLGVTALSFQEELHALAPAQPANGTFITSQI
jgi:hypothetical protein